MFLTTSSAAFTGSSITALSQAITTINTHNNHNHSNSSIAAHSPPSSSSTTPPAAQSLNPSGVSSAFKSKFSRSRREHALTARSSTSTSINSVKSAASSNTSASSAASSVSRATSIARSATSSISAPSLPSTNTTPASTPALSAKSTPPVTSPGGSSIQDPFEQVAIKCDPPVQPTQKPEPISLDTTTDETDSMRRRTTESLGSNLIPSSLRAVFRDNNHTAATTTENNTAGASLEQPLVNAVAALQLDDAHAATHSHPAPSSPTTSVAKGLNANAVDMPSIKFIPHQDSRASRPSLAFAPMTRTLPNESSVIRVGRYSERDQTANANNAPSSAPIGFKSKVVSRRHCEFWCANGQWYVKDVKSSSGTFLNHIRLSQPSTESKPFPINDGDIVQLGMDFRGGEESIFRCVKIRIEVNRGWQKKLNDFNTSTHKALRALSKETSPTSSTECSICLMSISPCQALFVAPCSHVWHYKCIRPVINNPKMYPQFLCPNCRAVTDLEADIEENVDGWDESDFLDHDAVAGESVVNRAGTPVNGHEHGEETQVTNQEHTTGLSVPGAPSISANHAAVSRNAASGISNEELQDTTMLFTEPSAIQIRDPRAAPELLEGLLTPRNEAGPFVFDGTRVEAPTASS